MKTYSKIFISVARCIKKLINKFFNLLSTSPTYWQLKDYDNGKQIGFNDICEKYINNLKLVWSKCHSIRHKGCCFCISIRKQFSSLVYYGRHKVIPIRTVMIKFCKGVGFNYIGSIICQKVTIYNTFEEKQ